MFTIFNVFPPPVVKKPCLFAHLNTFRANSYVYNLNSMYGKSMENMRNHRTIKSNK